MKAILIFILLGLTFSYNRGGAAAYAKKYCDKYNPDYNKYTNRTEESANFVSQCISAGGQDFEGCEGRDDKGMFKNSGDLKKCLIKKGWTKKNVPQKGSPAFVKVSYMTMIISDISLKGEVAYCSHTPDRCNGRLGHRFLEFYSPPK